MAITSPILKSISSTKKTISEGRSNIKKVGSILLRRVKVKREIFTQTNFLRQRRVETERRQQIEDEMEAPKVVTQPGGPQKLTQQSGSGGFFDRILGFIGYLAAGWLMNNLPTWIGIGKEFVARIIKAGQIISAFFNDTIKIFSGVGNLLGAIGQNLMRFDFFDTSNRVKNAMSGLNLAVGDIGKQIEEAYGLLTTPLTEGKYSGENIPGLGTEQTSPGAYEEPEPYTGTGGGGRWKPLLDLINSVESSTDRKNNGYDAQNGAPGGVRPGLSQMTIGEIARTAPGASGRYQQMPQYLLARAKSAGYNENTVFSPQVQDALAIKLIEGRGGNSWLAGKMSTEQFMQGLSQEWAALPNAYGGFAYSGQSSSLRPERVKSVLEQVKSGSSQSQQIEQVPAGNVNPTVTSRYGAQRGARTHGGTDLAVNSGTPLRAVSDGVIVDSDFEKGWGNFLVMKDNLGIYHLYGHMQSGYKRGGPVKKGEVIGKVGTTGRTTGPHLHWEAGTGWNGGTITGKFDPLNKYSKFAPFNTAPGPGVVPGTPAQISAPEQQGQMVPFTITPERRGQDIIIAQQPRNQQNIMLSSGGGGGQMPIQINEAELLNTFIKKKLLLDLSYL